MMSSDEHSHGEHAAPNGSSGDRPSSEPTPSGGARGFFTYELRGTAPLSDAQRKALVEYAVTERANNGSADRATRALELLGEGVGIVEPTGELVWMNHGLSRQPPETMRRFADACVHAIHGWRRGSAAGHPNASSVRATFRAQGKWYDVVTTPLFGSGGASIEGAVALLVDATATRRVQDRLDAIDQAGASLLELDLDEIRAQNPPERLRTLESRVLGATRSVLGFDNFEYRLTNRQSGQLELVFSSGLAPLGIGQRIYARAESNGLSGVVASTGKSIVCADVAKEPRYVQGLPGAASTLTVPLRLYDRVVGVLNVESVEHAHFDDEDRIGAELLGRYVALSLHMLDLLVTERCDTLRAMSETLAREAAKPLEELAATLRELRERTTDETTRRLVADVAEQAARVDEVLRNAGTAQRGILGAEEFMREGRIDPAFAGKTILVADDDATTRTTVREVFEQQGSIVIECADGAQAIRAVRDRTSAGAPLDLVISDIRMPDANGYEVFRATKDARAELPVILMTAFGYDPSHSIVRSSQEGLHCHLFKPIEISQLLEEARKALSPAK
ncbi:MAG: response regulator [bacterium]